MLNCNLEDAVAPAAAGIGIAGTVPAALTRLHRISAVGSRQLGSAAAVVGVTEDATAVAIHCLPMGCDLPFCDSISFVLVSVCSPLQLLSNSSCLRAAELDRCDRLQGGL